MNSEIHKDIQIIKLDVGERIISANGKLYQIIRLINVGKNGAVFLVKCNASVNNKKYALKIQYNLLERRLKRFNREVEFLKKQNKPWLLSYQDEGIITYANKSYPFVVTPYYPYTLEEYIVLKNVCHSKKIKFACNLAMALCYLKECNMVHRDIKPQNILTNGKHIVLADFGLIKSVLESNSTKKCIDIFLASSSMPRYYRTPELVAYARGETHAFYTESDTFQMGLVFSWLFTGKNPLLSSDDKLSDIILSDIPVVKGFEGKCINKFITAMLEMDYSKRIAPHEVANELLRIYKAIFLDGSQVV
ncbi:MAG: protein kinase [Oscillospiraceae bacterium]|nr:protein kinase [Oscillospiraceae bacterium]MDE6706611.1 protein kinase [Oscillospiraceae bacterium]MDE6776787.1 protein kinase [Oscillospiraceae bacterium]MDE7094573.1 protein kinase [Oscillospiraceae bacterium]